MGGHRHTGRRWRAPGGDALAEALKRNIYGGTPLAPDAPGRLAAYMREAVRGVRAQPPAELLGGKLHLPDPDARVFVEDKDRFTED